MDPRALKDEIEALKSEMGRLIDLGASFNEIYKISVELDKLIVALYKIQSGKFA
ncbi:MAG: aspartyl-phosphate phosphatase Spo0E family protein [Bacillota bacterium]